MASSAIERESTMINPFRRVAAATLYLLIAVSAAVGAPRHIPREIFNPPPSSSNPREFVRVGAKTFFIANSTTYGAQIWVTDGTAGGTTLVTSGIWAGAAEFKGALYFFRQDGGLWRTDGTPAGTVQVTTLPATDGRLYSAGSLLYIVTGSPHWGPQQLWVTNGEAGRTLRVRAFTNRIGSPIGHDGKLLFTNTEESAQVWSSDGTLWGTRAFTMNNACSSGAGCSYGVSLFKLGTRVFINVRKESSVYYAPAADLWQTDGTAAGTTLIKANVGVRVANSSSIAYLANGTALWKTDGTAAGTTALLSRPFMESPDAAMVGNNLFITNVVSPYSSEGYELWTSNGTAAGTKVVTRLPSAQAGAATSTRYFGIHSPSSDDGRPRLWTSDGTAAGTAIVAVVSSAEPSIIGGDYVLFNGYSPDSGGELWRSDGTAAGTFMLKQIAPEIPTGDIVGVVRDKAGAPVAKATINVYERVGTQLYATVAVTSGADGTYRVDRLTAGSYYLLTSGTRHIRQLYPNHDCQPCGIIANGEAVSVLGGTTTADVDFALTVGSQFTGTVRTPAGLPHHGAEIQIANAQGAIVATGRSRADGTYETTPGLASGQYYASASISPGSALLGVVHGGPTCRASYFGYDCNPYTLGGTPLSVTTGVAKALDFVLVSEPRISGKVLEQGSSAPLQGISVWFHDSAGVDVGGSTTNVRGEYVSPSLAPGTYFVSAQGSGRSYSSELWHNKPCADRCPVLEGRPVEITAGSGGTDIDFELTSLVTRIRITATDAATGAPMPNLKPVLYRNDGSVSREYDGNSYDARTDSDGRYEYRKVAPGTYFLKVDRQLYDGISCATCNVTAGKPIVVPEGGPVNIDINVAYRRPPTVSGRVTAADTGQALGNVEVVWRRVGSREELDRTMTLQDGTWTIAEPLAPAYLVFSTYGFMTEAYNDRFLACGPCEVPDGTTVFDPSTIASDQTGFDVALEKHASVSGIVRDLEGRPVRYASVYAYNSNGSFLENTFTTEGGEYQLIVKSPGSIYLSAQAYDYGVQLYKDIDCDGCSITSGTPIVIGPAAKITDINFTLKGGPATNEIRGTVYDAFTGKPLRDVGVIAFGDYYSAATATTDALGQYKLSVGVGSYRLVADASGAYLSRVYGGANCPTTCDRSTGTVVPVASGSIVTGIDFRLDKVEVTSISPAAGPLSGGTRVILSGRNLQPGTLVSFDGVPAKVLSITSTQIQVESPIGAVGYANIALVFNHRTLVLHDAFSYVTSASDGDLNGDRRSDVLWRNTSTGANDSWLMDTRALPVARAVALAANTWVFQTLADFNGDGISDIFWRNVSSGQNAVWYMNQNGSTPRSFYAPTQTTSWKFIGSGDFDRDGKADLFWQNSSTYQTQVWFGADGGTFRTANSNTVSAMWQAQGVGDLSGDARADVIWRNTSNGQVVVWNMNGATLVNSRPLGTVTTGMRLVGARDMDADGLADLFWRNDTTGENTLWLVNRTGVSIRPLSSVSGYNAVGLGDFNGDGRADVLWRHSSTGLPVTWIMSGATRLSAITLPAKTNEWTAYLAK